MNILAALFIEAIDVRQVQGPSTRLDLTGAHFSAVAPGPAPLVWAPHLVVVAHCPADHAPHAALEVVYRRGDQQLARNAQPLRIEPTMFTYRLVRAELEFEEFGTIEAHCRIDQGPVTVVPYTLLPPPPTAPGSG